MSLNNIKTKGQVIANPNDREIFARYLRDIAKLEPFSREEEQRLFKEYKETGNPAIKEKICKHNLLFVVSVAKHYSNMIPNSTITLEDLISEGNIGLCLAVDKFNYETGNKFISYAVWWIRQYILAAIQDHFKTIRLPSSIKNVIKKIERKESELEQLLGRNVTSEEIFEALSNDNLPIISAKAIDELYKMNSIETSLNKKHSSKNSDDFELIELIESNFSSPHEELENKERVELLNEMLTKIPTHARNYLIDYFGLYGGEQLSVKQMTEKYDVSDSAIRQTMDKYLRQLKYRNRKLGQYLFPTPNYAFEREWRKRNKDHENTIYLL